MAAQSIRQQGGRGEHPCLRHILRWSQRLQRSCVNPAPAVEGGELYGDGFIIAVRLQAMADSGGMILALPPAAGHQAEEPFRGVHGASLRFRRVCDRLI
jgi:hypothetical protein